MIKTCRISLMWISDEVWLYSIIKCLSFPTFRSRLSELHKTTRVRVFFSLIFPSDTWMPTKCILQIKKTFSSSKTSNSNTVTLISNVYLQCFNLHQRIVGFYDIQKYNLYHKTPFFIHSKSEFGKRCSVTLNLAYRSKANIIAIFFVKSLFRPFNYNIPLAWTGSYITQEFLCVNYAVTLERRLNDSMSKLNARSQQTPV